MTDEELEQHKEGIKSLDFCWNDLGDSKHLSCWMGMVD